MHRTSLRIHIFNDPYKLPIRELTLLLLLLCYKLRWCLEIYSRLLLRFTVDSVRVCFELVIASTAGMKFVGYCLESFETCLDQYLKFAISCCLLDNSTFLSCCFNHLNWINSCSRQFCLYFVLNNHQYLINWQVISFGADCLLLESSHHRTVTG